MMYRVGIDIAKDKFDVCLLGEEKQVYEAVFDNHKSGINKFHNWLKKHGAKKAHVCLEATGIYGDLVAETLYKRGYQVSVVNPARIKAYGNSQMRRNKTDALDARLIADYCLKQTPLDWHPPAPEVKELRALVRHLKGLQQEKQRIENRLEAQRDSVFIEQQLHTHIAFLQAQISQTKELLHQHVDAHSELKRQRDLLVTIPGLGEITAYRLLAELGDIRRFDNVRQVVAFIGLNPRQHQSGKKRTTHGISRMGRASLRASLYMPAIVAKRHNPLLAAFADRLQKRGLTGKQIIVAIMRKLIHLAYGILKSGQAFDPTYGQQIPIPA